MHDVARGNNPHLCLWFLSSSMLISVCRFIRLCAKVCMCLCVFCLLCVSAPHGNFWLRNRKCVGDYSSFEEAHNNISHHRIVHIWWNPHLGVASAKTVKVSGYLFLNYWWKMNNLQRRINPVIFNPFTAVILEYNGRRRRRRRRRGFPLDMMWDWRVFKTPSALHTDSPSVRVYH